MAELTYESLSGARKAVILLIALGVESSSAVLKNLGERDIEKLSIELANLCDIPSAVSDALVEEFYQMVLAQEYIAEGGIDYARTVLEQALGGPRTTQILAEVQGALHVSGFKLLKGMDASHCSG